MTKAFNELKELEIYTQDVITKAFSRMIQNPEITKKSLTEDGGKLTVYFGQVSSLKEYFTKVSDPIFLTKESVRANPAFNQYKSLLKAQGYSLDFCKDGTRTDSIKGFRYTSHGFLALAATSLITASPFSFLLSGMFSAMVGMYSLNLGHASMRIQKDKIENPARADLIA